MKKNNKCFLIIICLSVLVLFFVIYKIWIPLNEWKDANTLCCLEKHYNIIYKYFGTCLGVLGLVLGYYYYIEKVKIDAILRIDSRKRAMVESILRDVDSCDKIMTRLYNKNFDDDVELKVCLDSLQKYSENISMLLEECEKFSISKDAILSWLSFIGTNPIVRVKKKTEINKPILESSKDYSELLLSTKKSLMIDMWQGSVKQEGRK